MMQIWNIKMRWGKNNIDSWIEWASQTLKTWTYSGGPQGNSKSPNGGKSMRIWSAKMKRKRHVECEYQYTPSMLSLPLMLISYTYSLGWSDVLLPRSLIMLLSLNFMLYYHVLWIFLYKSWNNYCNRITVWRNISVLLWWLLLDAFTWISILTRITLIRPSDSRKIVFWIYREWAGELEMKTVHLQCSSIICTFLWQMNINTTP